MAVTEMFGANGSTFHLKEISGQRDATVTNLLEMIRRELSKPAEPSEMYLQDVAHALAVHLVRTYSQDGASAP
ncbi:hypothetical protein ACX3P0_24835 [Mesorhizobium sp. A556]